MAVALAGITGEFILNFYMGRFFGRHHLRRLILWLAGHSARFGRLANRHDLVSPLAIILLRLLPGPANNVSSLFLGATDLELLPYLWPSLLGAIPKAAVMTLAGSAVFNPASWTFWLFAGVCGLAAIPALVWQTRRQRADGALTAEEPSRH